MTKKQYVPRLKAHYNAVVAKQLQSEFGYKNIMQIPKVDKIVINMGVGGAVSDKKHITDAFAQMSLIAGQKPVTTISKKSIATFKLRDGMAIGCKVTLRKDKMWEFFDRLVNVALPRTRDFRGLNGKAFDGRGNYAMGLKEQIVFPEINYDDVKTTRGMDIIICTTANTDAEARSLLKALSMPFNN